MTGRITVEHGHRVATITIDRPRAKGALTADMVAALHRAVIDLGGRRDVEVVVVRGEGSDFCAGADIDDIAGILEALPEQRRDAFATSISREVHPLLRDLLALPQPLVVSARGHAVGIGVMLLLAADLVVASTTTKVSLPQPLLGHTVDHGESWLLPRRVGISRATQMCLLGSVVGAEDIERFGLANWLADDALLESRTREVVDGLLAVAPASLWRTKALLRSSLDATIEDQLALECSHASAGAATDDFVEAISALVARRPPTFVGR